MFLIREKESGNEIETFDTSDMAKKALAELEAKDKRHENYVKGFYEIVPVTAE
jgi:hypothetical protein